MARVVVELRKPGTKKVAAVVTFYDAHDALIAKVIRCFADHYRATKQKRRRTRQERILEFLRPLPAAVTLQVIQEALNIRKTAEAKRTLEALETKGLVRKVGRTRWIATD